MFQTKGNSKNLKVRAEVKRIKSENNFADVLTKNVSVGTFNELGKAIINGFDGYDEFSKFQKKWGE